jgi:signal transduction histidine kinase
MSSRHPLLLSAGLRPFGGARLSARPENAETEGASWMDSSEGEVRRREYLLRAVNTATRLLLARGDFDRSVDEALSLLGRAAEVDRVTLARHLPAERELPGGGWELEREWARPGLPRQIEGPWRRGPHPSPELLARLRAGESQQFNASRLPEPAEFCARWLVAGARSSLVVPVLVGGADWGVLGFDDCGEDRSWAPFEVAILETAAACIAAALERREMEQRRLQVEQARAEEAESMTRLLEGLVASSRALLDEGEFRVGLERWLARLGDAFGADRARFGTFESAPDSPAVAQTQVFWARQGSTCREDGVIPVTEDFVRWRLRLARGEFIWAHRDELEDPASVAFWEATECATSLLVPVVAERSSIAWIALVWAKRRPWAPELGSLLRTAADAAAAGWRRSEAARALLAEREVRLHAEHQRAEELAHANLVLRRSLGRIADDDNLERFFAELLKEAVATAGAAGGALLEHEPVHDVLIMRAHVLNGELCDLLRDPRNTPFREPLPAECDPVWRELCRSRALVSVDLRHPDPFGQPAVAEWHRAQGHGIVLALPLLLGERPIGVLGLALREGASQPTAARLSVVSALAQQAALALRMDQFAEQAAATAIAREHEHVAVARATVLARANHALRRSTASLVAQADLERFLGVLIQEAVLLSGARTAGVFAYDEATEKLQMVACLSDGVLLDLHRDPDMEIWRRPVPLEVTRAWVRRLADVEVMSFNNEIPAADHPWPISREWHLRRGHREVVDLPLFAGGKLVGFLGHCFVEHDWRLRFDLEQHRVFANHAALALQLARLAEKAKTAATESAVLSERNRLARDLHDTLAQGFTGVLAQLGAAEGEVEAGRSGRAVRYLDRAKTLARFSLAEARASVHALRPETNDGPLRDRLQRMVTTMTQGTELTAHVAEHGAPTRLRPASDWCAHKFVQEALANTVKHSGATHFAVTLRWEHATLRLSAGDNGCGFDPGLAREGVGLAAMRERAEEIGGYLHNESAPGRGCRIVLELPLLGK